MKKRNLKSAKWRLFEDQEKWLHTEAKQMGLKAAVYLRIQLDEVIRMGKLHPIIKNKN